MKTNENNYVIEAKNLGRSFGKESALRDITLRVPQGGIYGLLGRNGSGKTTAIKILAGLIKPTSGSVHVLGGDPFYFTEEERQQIGYLSEKQILPATLSVRQIVDFTAPLYARWDGELVKRLFQRFQIDDRKRIAKLSQGTQRQVAFILALAQRPKLLLLDEPASTLDVVARREFLDEILDLVRENGPTIFLSSHILSDIERVADHIGIIMNGTLKISASLDDLKDNVKRVRFFSHERNLSDLTLPNSLHTKISENEALVSVMSGDESLFAETARRFDADYEIQSLNLEDIFVEISRR